MGKILKSIFIFSFILAFWGNHTLAADNFVTVTFSSKVDAKFLKGINLMVGTSVDKKLAEYKYRLKIPPKKTVDEYSELFYFLPYVRDVEPLPRQKWEDSIEPTAYDYRTYPIPSGVPTSPSNVYIAPPSTTPSATLNGPEIPQYVKGEVMVQFKNGITPEEIKDLNDQFSSSVAEIVKGTNKYRIKLPDGIEVNQGIEMFKSTDIVATAEPNYKTVISAPASPASNSSSTQDPQKYVHVVTPIQITSGNEVFITFKAGKNPVVPDLFNAIFETRLVEKITPYMYRLRIPGSMKAVTAARIYKLCPYVVHVEATYGR